MLYEPQAYMDTIHTNFYMTQKVKFSVAKTDSNKNVMQIAFSYFILWTKDSKCNHVGRFLLLSTANVYNFRKKEMKLRQKSRFFMDYKALSARFYINAYVIEYIHIPIASKKTKRAAFGELVN